MELCVTFTTTDTKSGLPTGSATGSDGDSDDDTTPIIEVLFLQESSHQYLMKSVIP